MPVSLNSAIHLNQRMSAHSDNLNTCNRQWPLNESACGPPHDAGGCYHVNCHGNTTPADDLIQSGGASEGHMTGRKELNRRGARCTQTALCN